MRGAFSELATYMAESRVRKKHGKKVKRRVSLLDLGEENLYEAQVAHSAFVETGDLAALDYATQRAREAFQQTARLDTIADLRRAVLEILGVCLLLQYQLNPNSDELDEAMGHLATAAGGNRNFGQHVTFGDALYVLGLSLQHRRDESVVMREALLTETWRRVTPLELVEGLFDGPPSLMEAGIYLLQLEAANPTDSGPRAVTVRQVLTRACRKYASMTGDRSALDRAIDWSDTIQTDPERDIEYATSQLDRAACLALRYEATGDLTDLNLAIESCERGIETTLQRGFDPDEARLGDQWFELGLCRRMRGDRTKRSEDFEDALQAYRQGFALAGHNDVNGNNGFRALLNTDWGRDNLSEENSTLADLLTDDWLRDRSESGAIIRWNVARQQFFAFLNDHQIDQARDVLRALEGMSGDNAHLPARRLDGLVDVAGMWHRLYEISEGDQDRIRAIECNELVLDEAELRTLHEQANLWRSVGYLHAIAGALPAAREAYEAGLRAMNLAVRQATSRADQEHLLEGLSGLVSDVVVAACKTDDSRHAAEVAWESMGMLYREATRRRAVVHALSEDDPERGAELRGLYTESAHQWRQLDAGIGSSSGSRFVNSRRLHAERIGQLIAPYEQRLEEGIENQESADSQATDEHRSWLARVVICVSHMGVEAFVFTDDELPWFTFSNDARDHINELLDAYALILDGDVAGEQAETLLDNILHLVGDNLFEPIVDWLTDHMPGERPRVQFCLSGRLGTLPLGAVWIANRKTPSGDAARMNDLLSISLIPALTAYLPKRPEMTNDAIRPSLVVAAWNVPGRPLLVETRREAEAIANLLEPGDDNVLGLAVNNPATYDAVVYKLATTRLLHYTGHADIDYEHPDLSCLVLNDVAQVRLTAGAIAELDLSHGTLAVLSACAVGHTRGRLRDDPFDLGSAFLYAGYDFVVAPLRPIPDDLAAEATLYFYRCLLDGGHETSAHLDVHAAFEHMTAALRKAHPTDIMAWAGFVLLESPAGPEADA